MKVGLIGLGMVADTHVAAIKDASGVSLAGVLGRNPDKAARFAKKSQATLGYPVQTFDSLDDMLDPGTTDFVILATPPDARANFVDRLAAAGKPVLMEKPIERTYGAAQRIVEALERGNVPAGVFFQNRTRSAAVAFKQAIVDGELGDLVMTDIRVPWWREQSYYDEPGRGTYARDGGGVLINQAIHTIDLALWLFGPWTDVQAKLHKTVLHRMESEDWASASFETNGGMIGTFSATTAAYPGGSESITLHGTKASGHLESGVLKIAKRDGTQRLVGSNSTSGGGADPMAFTHAWHQRIIQDFAESLKVQRPPLVTARSALMSHAVIHGMERSNKESKRVLVEQA